MSSLGDICSRVRTRVFPGDSVCQSCQTGTPSQLGILGQNIKLGCIGPTKLSIRLCSLQFSPKHWDSGSIQPNPTFKQRKPQKIFKTVDSVQPMHEPIGLSQNGQVLFQAYVQRAQPKTQGYWASPLRLAKIDTFHLCGAYLPLSLATLTKKNTQKNIMLDEPDYLPIVSHHVGDLSPPIYQINITLYIRSFNSSQKKKKKKVL